MPEPSPDPHARIDALERRVAELEARLAAMPRRVSLQERVAGLRPPWLRWGAVRSEDVLGKAGIALLLIGVLFLLRYALDLDLLTPAVRVAAAGALGGVLLALGLRLRRRGRGTLGRLLAGGGVAALYGTLWAASQLYALLPTAVAFAGLLGVTALALALAVREADAALAVVGALGGLLTPLGLPAEGASVAPLVAYALLLVAGASAVYARRGWDALLGATALGGWALLVGMWAAGLWDALPDGPVAERLAFTAGVLGVALATGGLPPWRAAAARRAPHRWPSDDAAFAAWPGLVRPFTLAVLAAPLFAFGLLDATWGGPAGLAAAVAAALAAGYAAAAWRARAVPDLFEPFVLAAAVLAAWAVGRWVGGSDVRTLGTVVAAACAVVALARRSGPPDLLRLGHVAALGAGAWLVLVLAFAFESSGGGLPPGRLASLSAAAALAGAALGAVGLTAPRETWTRWAYVGAAHLVALAWLRVLLRPLGEGAALVSVAWGVYAVALVVAGLRLRDDLLRPLGLWTVLATALKVLVFDLDAMAVPWRIALFLGLGALLLAVSYFAPSLLRRSRADDEAPPP